ncbi:ABC transporter ATP-binding protein [Lacrimispora indolis]|uniref:ABC transporter ATP-binding protein n=1 Tax=Lacrimispora indolis TaxID=69825 RepID=UPI0004290156|nr:MULTISPECIES: ABC transporter ATP-binding protein [Lachnospiraceae]
MEKDILLEVKDLQTHFFLEEGNVKALDGISFCIRQGETLGVVGESGCGKSLTALSVMRQVPDPPGRIAGGEVLFEGEDLLKKSNAEMRKIRGGKIAMIFQEPMTSLNPVMTVGIQIAETLRIHQKISRREAKQKAIEMLRLVKIPLPEQRYGEYPHQLSGGMRQRVMIGMALACSPDLLICDEPTTALDVTVQAQILQLIEELKKSLHMAVMLITHDLGVISSVADKVIIMYAGKIVEYGAGENIFLSPLHPYTKALLSSVPKITEDTEKDLYMIKGMVPNLLEKHEGCLFAPRCDYACDKCFREKPEFIGRPSGTVRCFRYASDWEGK